MPATRRRPQHLESQEQRLFVQRFRLDPRTRDLPACAIPNGGRRNAREAALMKAEGVSAGAPDWVLFVASRDTVQPYQYHGLALEFKRPDKTIRVTPAQADWHQTLRAHGWRVEIVKSAQEAWTYLCRHLDIDA